MAEVFCLLECSLYAPNDDNGSAEWSLCVCSKEAGRTTGRATRTATDKYYIIYSKDCNNEGLRKLKIDHRSIDRSYTCTSSSMCIWYHFTATYQQHIHACPIITIIIFMHTYPLSTDIRYIHTCMTLHCTCYPAPIYVISVSSHLYKQQEKPLITPVHIQLHI